MAITSSTNTWVVKALVQGSMGGLAVTTVILGTAHATGTTTGIDLGNHQAFTMLGGTAPAVGDTITFTIA